MDSDNEDGYHNGDNSVQFSSESTADWAIRDIARIKSIK
jgi:hypothetical protein